MEIENTSAETSAEVTETETPESTTEVTETSATDRRSVLESLFNVQPAEAPENTEVVENQDDNQEETPNSEEEESTEIVSEENTEEDFYQAQGLKIKTPEEIDTVYNRVPIPARDEMKRYAEVAVKHQEIIDKLGGENLLEPAVNSYQSLQNAVANGDYSDYLKQVAFTGGFDGLFGFMDETLFRVLYETKNRPTDPAEAQLYDANLKILNSNLENRFGEGYTLEKLEKLIQADQSNLVDFDLLGESTPQPSAENLELKRQVEDLTNQVQQLTNPTEEKTTPSVEFEQNYSNELKTYLEPVLNWQTIKPLETDSQDIKDIKAAVSEIIIGKAEKTFRNSAQYQNLLSKFENKQISLPNFKAEYDKAIKNAALSTGDFATKAKKFISSLYKNSRNLTVKTRIEGKPPTEKSEPTKTTNFNPDPQSAEELAAARKAKIAQSLENKNPAQFNPFR